MAVDSYRQTVSAACLPSLSVSALKSLMINELQFIVRHFCSILLQ